ncbi:MAG: PAS domain S-box protein [gamma proteobacterium symbiont of Phacoides pectinatus]
MVKREFSDLQARRELERTKCKLSESETRCTTLIESSQDAIAYIHAGMHVHANPTYLEMFGYMDLEEIEGMPILDMISKEEHRRFKAFLRALGMNRRRWRCSARPPAAKPLPQRWGSLQPRWTASPVHRSSSGIRPTRRIWKRSWPSSAARTHRPAWPTGST